MTEKPRQPGAVERWFEAFLWKSRLIVLTGVIASLISAFILFTIATLDVFSLVGKVFSHAVGRSTDSYDIFHGMVISHVIGAIDDYLLGTVLLIFALGLYELFISKIDQADEDSHNSSKILLIKTLDDLKDRLAKVVLMILIVTFFKNVVHTTFVEPINILYLGGGILFVALALYFTHRSGHQEGK